MLFYSFYANRVRLEIFEHYVCVHVPFGSIKSLSPFNDYFLTGNQSADSRGRLSFSLNILNYHSFGFSSDCSLDGGVDCGKQVMVETNNGSNYFIS